ncbi:MAG: aminotransferase class III-fold pyridoxal phosphate-dependent enzyme [Candidatus Omnitrophica bacterium]|nr:aminotransferase class III-fold pyridoxal phosphate-dependent enzyme [Candidatus Omnitrophota bacterium]
MGKSQELYKKAKKLIPGGTQLFSKRPEMFLPENWPAYYSKAKGCEIWDLDGKRYIDMSYMGIGACIIGYTDPDIDKAVKRAVSCGNMTTLNVPEEVELAELLIKLHPWADMVRYARCGGEAMAIAVRIARAATGKDLILFCGYHGWSDWYLASNLADDKSLDGHLLSGLEPKGVPRALKGTAIPFNYNDTQTFLSLINKYKGKIAAVIIEPIRNKYPSSGFLEVVRNESRKAKAVLIMDEVSSGWRLCVGGAHKLFNIEPDIAVFAKAISNGFPMAAIIGRKKIMQNAQDSFISSTYWTDRIGPAAALAAIKKMKLNNIPEHLNLMGMKIQNGWKISAERHSVDIKVDGIYPLSHFSFNYKEPLVLKTLFTQYMLQKGFLATNAYYASYAHKEKHIEVYLEAVESVFASISKALKKNRPELYLKGPVCHSGFKRLT